MVVHSPKSLNSLNLLQSFLIASSVALLAACGGGDGGNNSGGGGSTAPVPSCAGAGFTPFVSYGALSATVGTPVSLAPSTNLPAACAGSVNYAVFTGALPAGLTLNTSTGMISGIPTSVQSVNYGVSMDVLGYTLASTPLTFASVAPAPLPVAKQWTMMVYIAGDNNLAQFAADDINELKAAATNANINVVVQVERGTTPVSNLAVTTLGTSTYRGLINGAGTQLADIGNQNMGAPSTLSNFIAWSKANYPAQNYSLVLWSHGGGWKANKAARGALQDELSNSWMSLSDIRSAVTSGMGAGNKLGVLTFDACQMGQYEVAYEMRNTAHYLVASEENVPGPGLPYTQVVNLLSANPSNTPAAFATGMANAFRASYASAVRESTTMSVTDLSQMDAVHNKVLDFSTQAKAALSSQAAVLNNARQNAMPFAGSVNVSDSIDLWQYANDVATNATAGSALKTEATALRNTLTSAIVTNTSTGASMANAKGMAIYFPSAGTNYNATTYANSTLASAPVAGKDTWQAFLSALYSGTSFANKVVGDFAYYITWTNPAGIKVDIDLAVNEPRGNWASPSIGTTSPNATLSGDSYFSNQNFESYTALSQVETGAYDVFANLYTCTNAATGASISGASCTTQVTLCEKAGGASAFACRAPVTLDFAHQSLGNTFYTAAPSGTVWNQVINNTTSPYWDWYYFGRINKSVASPKEKFKQVIVHSKMK